MYQRLQQCAKIPDFNNYLAFILTQGEGTQDEIRQTAGLLLKNNLKTGWQSTEPAHQAYIQRALLPALGHPNRFLRHTVGTALSMITRAVGPRGWPGLYTTLAQILEQPPDVTTSTAPSTASTRRARSSTAGSTSRCRACRRGPPRVCSSPGCFR